MNGRSLYRLLYFAVLALVAGVVLAAFVYPSCRRHSGLNDYDRAKFLAMVDGQAHKPYVYRTLLPTAVRAVSGLAPDRFEQAVADRIEADERIRGVFDKLRWETRGAFRYLTAAVLFLLCFMGFGHALVRLTEGALGIAPTGPGRLLLVTGALAGLPPFFKYVSYPYDPAQLLLFTLALLLLATRRLRAFLAIFVLCCLNKETAILLIPLFVLAQSDQPVSRKWYRGMLIALVGTYAIIKVGLAITFRDNPGGLTEFQLAHNLRWLAKGWSFPDVATFLALTGLVTFRWSEKPALLRRSFLWVLLPLAGLACFLGFFDEWRGYYEAYPLAFVLIVHSILRLRELGSGAVKPSG